MQNSHITNDSMLLNFSSFQGHPIRTIKKLIPPEKWQDLKSTKVATIGKRTGQIFKIFFLKPNQTIFWSKFEQERTERYLILNGSCDFQLKDNVFKVEKGSLVEAKAEDIRSFCTSNNEEVVIGWLQVAYCLDDNWRYHRYIGGKYSSCNSKLSLDELKYSRTSRLAKYHANDFMMIANCAALKSRLANIISNR